MKTRVSLKYFVADCWLRGMLSWVLLKFILVIYSNASQLTYFLIGPLAMARRVIGIKSVRPSVWKFSWNWLFLFLEFKMELGAHVMLCMTAPNFLEIMFCPKNGENRPSLGFFECIGKFSFFFSILWFFLNFVNNESFYYSNCCMLEQNTYLGKFWSLRYGPRCSWSIRLWEFSVE